MEANEEPAGQSGRSLFFLGPEGSFTHQAALGAAQRLGGAFTLRPCSEASRIVEHVERGDGWGVLAWENNVEGVVVPNLDMLLDAGDVAGLLRVGEDVSFDAFVRPGADVGALREVTAHPHGLAQCKGFVGSHGFVPVPASSNAAACRDIRPDQVALGPAICGSMYGLRVLERAVQDYDGARTDFLVLAPRSAVGGMAAPDANDAAEYETIVAFVPLSTGPGVLANLLDMIRDAGLNMTSFMSRPIKGRVGTYSFIATLDAAPWQARFSKVLSAVVSGGDWVKTLAVYPKAERSYPPVDAWMLPRGGVRVPARQDDKAARKELLW